MCLGIAFNYSLLIVSAVQVSLFSVFTIAIVDDTKLIVMFPNEDFSGYDSNFVGEYDFNKVAEAMNGK